MINRNHGYILNVASAAAFQPGGPLMATYYATKSYVYSLTEAIYYELKKRKSNISISSSFIILKGNNKRASNIINNVASSLFVFS